VASYSITEARSRPKLVRSDVAVAAMAALGGHGSGGGGGGGGGGIVAGCTDGFLRLLDPRMREITGEIRGHPGGVVQVATSPYGDYGGTLIATTGYGSARSAAADAAVSSSLLYGFPNPSVLVYDIRYVRFVVTNCRRGPSWCPRILFLTVFVFSFSRFCRFVRISSDVVGSLTRSGGCEVALGS
jgi:hypothetical protein